MNQSLNLAAPLSAAPVTLAQLVFSSAERFAGRTAIEENSQCIDYADLPDRVMGFAAGLDGPGYPGRRPSWHLGAEGRRLDPRGAGHSVRRGGAGADQRA